MKLDDKKIILPQKYCTNSENSNESIDLFSELKCLNSKQRELYIFKLFYNGIDRATEEQLKNILHNHPFMFKNFKFIVDEALESHEIRLSEQYNRETCCPEIMQKYKSLLEKISCLAKELDISNTLELSILFSYLLWRGYLSKTKEHKFQPENRKLIIGLLFANITDGIGVCLDYSEMLKDFLNYCGYNSTIISNHFDNNSSINYKMDIGKMAMSNQEPKKTIFKIKEANHAFNLIEDNGGLYIYDTTHLLLYNVVNSEFATLINGKGKNKLYPYQSYGFCFTKEDIALLDKLYQSDDLISPYTTKDFMSISEVNLEIIRNSTSLLEDFYTEARSDILYISEETDKIVKKRILK